jgi:RNA polymerase sigma-70 factor (ECF subfamily)
VPSPVPVHAGPIQERKLLQRLLQGEDAAYAELVAQYEKPLANFIFRYVGNRTVAEDLFQETFYRMMRSLDSYRPRAGFGTWLFTIARNVSLDYLKMQRRHREVPLDAPSIATSEEGDHRDVLPSAEGTGDEALEHREDQDRVGSALRRLPPKLREALLLRVYHELPYRDIARITRAPVGTAKYRVHEALHALARLMGVEKPRSDV